MEENMTTGIRRNPLQSEIMKFIREYIESNHLQPGDRLPSQEKLIEMMGVSRTALREAIKTLEARDIIKIVNGKGVFVQDDSLQGLLAQLEFTKEKELLVEVLEARKILEREIVTLVIKNITNEELTNLENILDIIIDKYNRGERQNVEDKKFHYMVYEYSHNRIMQQLILSISGTMEKLWEFPLNMDSPFTETIPTHVDFFNALKRRDLKMAQYYNDKILGSVIQDVLKSQYKKV
jgi:GntR family transcriptional regulator, transcriptional repressor for pyruvate dehydrogenase complex